MSHPYRKQLALTVKTTCRACKGRGFVTFRLHSHEIDVKALCVCVEMES